MPYFNPSTMFGNNAQLPAGNPLNGALAGIQGAYSMAYGNQGLQEGQAGLMARLHELEQAKLDDPLNAAKREAGIADAGVKKSWDESGGALDALQSGLASTKANTANTNAGVDEKTTKARGDFIVQVSEELKHAPDPFTNPKAATDLWSDIKDRAKKVGMDFPGSVWTPEIKATVEAKAKGWVNNAEEQRKMAAQTAQAEAQHRYQTDPEFAGSTAGASRVAVAREAASTDKALQVEALKGEHQKAIQELKNQNSNNIKSYEQLAVDNVSRMVRQDMKTDGKLSMETQQAAVAAAKLSATKALASDSNYELLKTEASHGNAEAQKKVDVQFKEMVNNYLDTIPGYKEAESKSSGRVVSTPPAGGVDKAKDILTKARAGGKNKDVSDKDILDAAKAKGLL